MGAKLARANGDLTDAEEAAGCAALEARLGATPSRRDSRRLALGAEGEWLLEFDAPLISTRELGTKNPRFRDTAPWSWPSGDGTSPPLGPPDSFAGMQAVRRYLPLDEAIALLHGPESPEVEIERRRKLFDEAVERARAAEETRLRTLRAEREAAAKHTAERPLRWAALSRAEKVMFVAATEAPHTVAEGFLLMAKLTAGSDHALAFAPDNFEPELV